MGRKLRDPKNGLGDFRPLRQAPQAAEKRGQSQNGKARKCFLKFFSQKFLRKKLDLGGLPKGPKSPSLFLGSRSLRPKNKLPLFFRASLTLRKEKQPTGFRWKIAEGEFPTESTNTNVGLPFFCRPSANKKVEKFFVVFYFANLCEKKSTSFLVASGDEGSLPKLMAHGFPPLLFQSNDLQRQLVLLVDPTGLLWRIELSGQS